MTETMVLSDPLEDMLTSHTLELSYHLTLLEKARRATPEIHAITFEGGNIVARRIRSDEEIRIEATINTINDLFRHKMKWFFILN